MAKNRAISVVRICEKCGRKYHPWKANRPSKFCSRECSPRGRVAKKPSSECLQCGVLFRRWGGRHQAKFCSRKCYLDSNPKKPTDDGYILIYAPGHSTRAHGQALEHRVVMAKHIGRKLEPWETVHHINGNKSDNRIENLQLMKGNHGKGTVHKCADCGSYNIVTEQLTS